jgi:hypothetical protein
MKRNVKIERIKNIERNKIGVKNFQNLGSIEVVKGPNVN